MRVLSGAKRRGVGQDTNDARIKINEWMLVGRG